MQLPLAGWLENHQDLELIFEPGRAIAANAGILLTRVEFLKHTEHKNFAIIDAAMNDLMRPALYQAWQDIVPVSPREGEAQTYDLVGPICETGDFLGKDDLFFFFSPLFFFHLSSVLCIIRPTKLISYFYLS